MVYVKNVTMNNMKKIWMGVLALLALAACSSPKPKTEPVITVSILPQKYFVEQILGDKYKVNVIVRPGFSPETYEPAPAQMKHIERSGLYLQVCQGGFDEPWINSFKSLNSDMKVVDTSKGVDLVYDETHDAHEGHEDCDHIHLNGIDPHLWVSPGAVRIMVENTRDALLEYLPDDSLLIRERSHQFLVRIIEIDSMYRASLSPYKGGKFMVYHPILSYVARDYGLEQMSLEIGGKEPSVNHLTKLINQAKSHKIKLIFVQQEFDTRNAQLIATETSANVVKINPLGYQWERETLNTLKFLVNSFESASK
jgi:zinc transport system substrate-binding protein